jgi:hypothetical protein
VIQHHAVAAFPARAARRPELVGKAVRNAVAQRGDPACGRGQDNDPAFDVREVAHPEIGALVAVVGKRAAGVVAGAGPGIDVEIVLHEAVLAQGTVDRNFEARRLGCRRASQTANHQGRRQDPTDDVPVPPVGWCRNSVASCQANTPRLPDPDLLSRRW